MTNEREDGAGGGTSEVEAVPDADRRAKAPAPGETPGTAETEATPDAGAPETPRRGA